MQTADSTNKLALEYGIYRAADCWMVVTLGPPSEVRRVMGLFDTLALPMPLMAYVDERRVRELLTQQNPGCAIVRMADKPRR